MRVYFERSLWALSIATCFYPQFQFLRVLLKLEQNLMFNIFYNVQTRKYTHAI
jgi:hypothetical protein